MLIEREIVLAYTPRIHSLLLRSVVRLAKSRVCSSTLSAASYSRKRPLRQRLVAARRREYRISPNARNESGFPRWPSYRRSAQGHGEKNPRRACLVSITSISGIPKCS
jgi:hypothetical protein